MWGLGLVQGLLKDKIWFYSVEGGLEGWLGAVLKVRRSLGLVWVGFEYQKKKKK